MIQALTMIARATGNEYMTERVLALRDGVERGEGLYRTAQTADLFTPLALQMISIGEETGALAEMLDEVADFYEREVDYDLENLSAALEPILIVSVGGMVSPRARRVPAALGLYGRAGAGRVSVDAPCAGLALETHVSGDCDVRCTPRPSSRGVDHDRLSAALWSLITAVTPRH